MTILYLIYCYNLFNLQYVNHSSYYQYRNCLQSEIQLKVNDQIIKPNFISTILHWTSIQTFIGNVFSRKQPICFLFESNIWSTFITFTAFWSEHHLRLPLYFRNTHNAFTKMIGLIKLPLHIISWCYKVNWYKLSSSTNFIIHILFHAKFNPPMSHMILPLMVCWSYKDQDITSLILVLYVRTKQSFVFEYIFNVDCWYGNNICLVSVLL